MIAMVRIDSIVTFEAVVVLIFNLANSFFSGKMWGGFILVAVDQVGLCAVRWHNLFGFGPP